MNQNILGKSTLALIALSGLATAGEVRLGDRLVADGIRFSARTSLGCKDVQCSAGDGVTRPIFSSISDGRGLLVAPTSASGNYSLSTDLSLQRQSSGFTSITAGASHAPASSAVVTTVPDTEAANVSAGTFVLSGGRVIGRFQNGWAYTDTGDYVGGKGNAYSSSGARPTTLVQPDFSDPIVSAAFNVYSTGFSALPDPSINGASLTNFAINMPFGAPSSTTGHNSSSPLFTSALLGPGSLNTGSTPSSSQGTSTTMGVTNAGTNVDPNGPPAGPDGSNVGNNPQVGGTDGILVSQPFGGNLSAPLDAPEPATDLLIGSGLIAAGAFAKMKRSSRS